MKLKATIANFLLIVLTTAGINPIFAADRVQVANMIDWNGINLNEVNSTISQSITVGSLPSLNEAEVHLTLNLGNSEGILTPHFMLINRNEANFGFFDLPSEPTFVKSNPSTSCNYKVGNVFGNSNRFSADCTTAVNVISGETYEFTITRKSAQNGFSINAAVKVKSSGNIIDIGTVNFSIASEQSVRSSSISGFNQTSIYGYGLTCNSKIPVSATYSALSNNGILIGGAQIRSGGLCSAFLPVKQGDDAYTINFGTDQSFSCPAIEDSTPTSYQPSVTSFLFTGTNQKFVRYQNGTQIPVTSSAPLVGCYGDLTGLAALKDIGWQYGVIGRDANGFYWKNGAGIKWGLSLDNDGLSLTTDNKNPYFSNGNKFNLNGAIAIKKPSKPIFKGFNIVGNTLNLNLNIGSGSNKPDNVFLIAPTLGISNTISGDLGSGVATFAVPLSASLLGGPLNLGFYSVKNGINSDTLDTTINLPASNVSNLGKGNKYVPLPAINPKYVIGALLVNITAQTQPKANGTPIGGYLVSNSLGITSSNPIFGRVVNGKASFSMPISPTLAGRTIVSQIYLTNEIGDSKPLNVSIKFPGAPSPTLNKKVNTIICKKGSQARTFVGQKCPPGWK